MDKNTKKRLIRRLHQYRYIDEIIERREMIINAPFVEDADENVGGGKKQNENDTTVERRGIKLATDPMLLDLKYHKKMISRALNDTDTLTRNIIVDKYMNHYSKTKTALINNVSQRSLYNYIDNFLEDLALLIAPTYD